MTEPSLPTTEACLSGMGGRRKDYKGNLVMTTNRFLIFLVLGDHHNKSIDRTDGLLLMSRGTEESLEI